MSTTTIPEVCFKEILVASDLSDASTNAIGYAKAIAKHFGSHIVLAHVSEPGPPMAIPEGEWIQQDANQIEEQMQTAGVALRAEGLAADAVNTYGPIRQEIEAIADEYQSDLIVLGTHGRRGLKRFRSARVVAYAYRLAQNVGAAFELLSVDDSNHPADRDLTWHAFEEALAEALPEELGKSQIRSLLSGKSPAENIVDVAKALKSDLIVMGARTVQFATTHMATGVLGQVLADAPCPVLTIATE